MCAHQQTGTGAPAVGALPDVIQEPVGQGWSEQADKFIGLAPGERQGAVVDLQQLTVEKQARQVPCRTLPATDPQLHRGRGLQQGVDPGVQFGAGAYGVIIQYQGAGSVQALKCIQQCGGVRSSGDAKLLGNACAEAGQRHGLPGKIELHQMAVRGGKLKALANQ
ncbi:hypothetical protein D9M71_170660 [compost metagenome]